MLDHTGYEYDLVSLRGKTINGCIACLDCLKDNVRKVEDDQSALRRLIVAADALVIGAPNSYSTLNAAAQDGRLLGQRRRDGHDRPAVTARIQHKLMALFGESALHPAEKYRGQRRLAFLHEGRPPLKNTRNLACRPRRSMLLLYIERRPDTPDAPLSL